jgi:hypothetical protein
MQGEHADKETNLGKFGWLRRSRETVLMDAGTDRRRACAACMITVFIGEWRARLRICARGRGGESGQGSG